jgi:hypothetical protein
MENRSGPPSMSWLQALMPKDDRFFELFAAHSRTILAGANDLRALLNPKFLLLRA